MVTMRSSFLQNIQDTKKDRTQENTAQNVIAAIYSCRTSPANARKISDRKHVMRGKVKFTTGKINNFIDSPCSERHPLGNFLDSQDAE